MLLAHAHSLHCWYLVLIGVTPVYLKGKPPPIFLQINVQHRISLGRIYVLQTPSPRRTCLSPGHLIHYLFTLSCCCFSGDMFNAKHGRVNSSTSGSDNCMRGSGVKRSRANFISGIVCLGTVEGTLSVCVSVSLSVLP